MINWELPFGFVFWSVRLVQLVWLVQFVEQSSFGLEILFEFGQ